MQPVTCLGLGSRSASIDTHLSLGQLGSLKNTHWSHGTVTVSLPSSLTINTLWS